MFESSLFRMLIFSLILLLMSNTISLRRDKSILCFRIVINSLALTSVLAFNNLYTELYYIIHIFYIFILSAVVLLLVLVALCNSLGFSVVLNSLSIGIPYCNNIILLCNELFILWTLNIFKVEKMLEQILNNILLEKDILNSMSIKNIIIRIWNRKSNIVIFCSLFFIIRYHVISLISPMFAYLSTEIKNILLISSLALVFYIILYGVIIGFINKYNIVCNLVIRAILIAIFLFVGIDFLSLLAILDLWFIGIQSINLVDNFGEWIFIRTDSHIKTSSDKSYNSGGNNGPNKPDNNNVIPFDNNTENNTSRKRKYTSESTYIITNYENLEPMLKKRYEMGNGSTLSIYINAGLKGKGVNMPILNDDICLMIWDYINLDMMYSNGYKKGEFYVPPGKKVKYCDLESDLGLPVNRRSNSDRIITGVGANEITSLKRLPKHHKDLPIFGHMPLCNKKFFYVKSEIEPHNYSAWDTSRLFYEVPLYYLGHGSGYYLNAVTSCHTEKVTNLMNEWNKTFSYAKIGGSIDIEAEQSPLYIFGHLGSRYMDLGITIPLELCSEEEIQYFSQPEVHEYYENKLNSIYNRLLTETLFMQTKIFSAMEKESFLHVHNKNCFCRRSKIIALTHGTSNIIFDIHKRGNYVYGGIHKKNGFRSLTHTSFEY